MSLNKNLPSVIRKISTHFTKNYLPSRYIFMFDVSVVFTSFFLAHLLRFNFVVSGLNFANLAEKAILAVFVYGFCFLIQKSFIGIIRHTNLDDIFKVFKATSSGFLFLLGVTYFARLFKMEYFGSISLSVLLIHFLITYFILIAFRIGIKTIFSTVQKSNNKKTRQNILIYGAGAAGMLTRNAMCQDSQINYYIVGFIDDNSSKVNKLLEGIPVYHPSQALSREFIVKKEIDGVILSIQSLNKEYRKSIIEKCLELNVEVKSVPPIHKWINGQLSSGQIKKVNIEDLLEREPIRMDSSHVAQDLIDKVVMITGAAGSIGSGIVRQILTFKPKKLILLDQAESGLYDLQTEINGSAELKKYAYMTELVIASIKDRYRLKQIFQKYRPEVVYHAAAYKHVPLMEHNPYEALLVNVFGTKAMVDLSIEFGVKKFVMISTDKAVNPTNVMGASKRIAEIYAQSINSEQTRIITTRFGNVLGSSGSVVPLFKNQIENGGPITLTNKNITRYFMTIPEACSLVLEAGAMGKGGEIFVFDMGKPVKIYDLAKKMIQLSGLEVGKDIEIKEIGLRPGEKLFEELLNDEENTLPTYHSKILRAKVRTYRYDEIESHLLELASLILDGDKFRLVRKMKDIVPEFISNNSVYDYLDIEKVN